ncbi:MAG: hemerythrin family protein [Patescibacteria group bacterium]|nr:hemerythrin family protein [Patescibacteria group bacterium]
MTITTVSRGYHHNRRKGTNAMDWNDSYRIGYPLIDEQHQGLFRSINEFSEKLETDDCHAEAGSVLRLLVGYVNRHFSDEEAFMEDAEVPFLEQHRKKHQAYTEAIKRILLDLRAGKELDLHVFNAFLQKWLAKHILTEDMKLKDYLPR